VLERHDAKKSIVWACGRRKVTKAVEDNTIAALNPRAEPLSTPPQVWSSQNNILWLKTLGIALLIFPFHSDGAPESVLFSLLSFCVLSPTFIFGQGCCPPLSLQRNICCCHSF